MKFKHTGTYHTGHGVTHSVLEKVNFNDKTNLTYTTDFKGAIEEEEKDSNILYLVIDWKYIIYYKGYGIFDFNSTQRYFITEPKVPASENDLQDIVRYTFKHLSKSFDERRQEFKVFEKMEDIHSDTIEQLARQLKEVLLQIPAK